MRDVNLKGCVKRSLAAVDDHLNGRLKVHPIDDVDVHRSLLFPRENPEPGHCVNIEEAKTGKIHGVAFDRFSYPTAPDEVVPMEAFSFDPKNHHVEIGIGYLRRLGRDRVQLGFLEVVNYQKYDDEWVKTHHHEGIKSEHPLIDAAIASWKFGEHMGTKN